MSQSSTRSPWPRRHALSAIALTGLGFAVPAHAAGLGFQLPAWDSLAARNPGAAAVVLLNETSSELGFFGNEGVGRRVEVRWIVAILDPARASKWLSGEVQDTPVDRLNAFEARVVTSSRHIRRLDTNDLHDVGEVLTTLHGVSRIRSYQMGEIPPRSVVEVHVTHIRPSLVSLDEHVFGAEVPVAVSRARLILRRFLMTPRSMRTVRTFGSVPAPEIHNVPRPDGDVREYVWEMRDLAPLPQEPLMPSASEVAPAIWIAPSSGESEASSWPDLARQYYERSIAPQSVSSADVHALAMRLAPSGLGPGARIRALHDHVRDEIQTIEGSLERSGYDPQPPPATLRVRRGSALDKACLLRALLAEAGIDARLALVRGRSGGPADTSFLDLGQFDRPLVWTPVAGGWWLDPGASVAADYLPAEDQGVVALVVGPGPSVLTMTPALPPEASALERRVAARLDSLGALTGTVELRATGQLRTDLERTLWAPGGLERDAAERLMRARVGDARLAGFRAAQPRDAGPLLLSLDVAWSLPTSNADTLRLPEPLLAPPEWGQAVEAPARRFPIVFEGTEQHRDRIHLTLPRGYSLEGTSEVTVSGRWFSLFVTSGQDSTGAWLDRTLELRDPTVLIGDLDAARDEFRRVFAAYEPRWRLVRRR
jgi:hypothetical protein